MRRSPATVGRSWLRSPARRCRLTQHHRRAVQATRCGDHLAERSLPNRGDSVWWTGATASFPNSRISGDGRFTIANNDFRLRVRANPVAVADIHWIDPTLPDDGSGTLDFSLDWVGDTSVYVARNADVRLETAHLRGQLGVKMIALTPGASLHDTDMRFTGVSTRLVEQIFPQSTLPGREFLQAARKSRATCGIWRWMRT